MQEKFLQPIEAFEGKFLDIIKSSTQNQRCILLSESHDFPAILALSGSENIKHELCSLAKEGKKIDFIDEDYENLIQGRLAKIVSTEIPSLWDMINSHRKEKSDLPVMLV